MTFAELILAVIVTLLVISRLRQSRRERALRAALYTRVDRVETLGSTVVPIVLLVPTAQRRNPARWN